MEHNKKLRFSISACTRGKREGETEGVDYYFLSQDRFREKIDKGEFVEWEEVYPGHFYGTLHSEVERIRNAGYHVVFDVDVLGGLNIKKQFGPEALAVFVRPPSVAELEKRLTIRGTDDPEKIRLRVARANYELTFEDQFDRVIVNDQLEQAKRDTIEVVDLFLNSDEPSTDR